MAHVQFDGATRVFDKANKPAVADLDLRVHDGEFLVLVGPSGCGKSTSLRMLAGLEEVDGGRILIGDRDVTHLPVKDRDIAMVFQNFALYPHMTVAGNMGFALKLAGLGRTEIRTRVVEAATLLDLMPYLDRKPRSLSGGQRQRVAMGRAIVREPQVFLMDEPLSNLDAKLRVSTRTQISSLQRRLGVTTVYVTHDQTEAMTMGDRVAVLHDGVLQQVDTPLGLYERPVNAFVAGFIGSPAMNLVAATRGSAGWSFGSDPGPSGRSVLALQAPGDRITVGFRPESVELVGTDAEDGFAVSVDLVEQLGSDAFVHATLAGPGGREAVRGDGIVARVDPRHVPRTGELVRLRIRPGETHLFDAHSELRVA